MKIITKDEAAEWCRNHGLAINQFGVPAVRDIPEAKDFPIPIDAGQRTALAREQLGKLRVYAPALFGSTTGVCGQTGSGITCLNASGSPMVVRTR